MAIAEDAELLFKREVEDITTFIGLVDGSIKPINQFTEPEVDIKLDAHAEIMQAVLKNPDKQALFIIWVDAERRSDEENKDETDQLNMRQLHSILTPIFTDPEFVVGAEEYAQYIDKATELGFFNSVKTDTVEEILGQPRIEQ